MWRGRAFESFPDGKVRFGKAAALTTAVRRVVLGDAFARACAPFLTTSLGHIGGASRCCGVARLSQHAGVDPAELTRLVVRERRRNVEHTPARTGQRWTNPASLATGAVAT